MHIGIQLHGDRIGDCKSNLDQLLFGGYRLQQDFPKLRGGVVKGHPQSELATS